MRSRNILAIFVALLFLVSLSPAVSAQEWLHLETNTSTAIPIMTRFHWEVRKEPSDNSRLGLTTPR